MSLRTKQTPAPIPSPQRWLLQIRKGELRVINELSELIRLILERRIDRNALLYKITDEPRVIGELPEFAELFDGGPATPPPHAPGSDTVHALESSHTFDPMSDEVPYLDTISPLGSTDTAFGDEYDVVPRRRWPAALLGLTALAAVGGIGYLALQRKPTTNETLAVAPPLAKVPPAAPAPVAAPAPTPAPAPEPVVAAEPAPAPAPVAAAAPVAAPEPVAEPVKPAEEPPPAVAPTPPPAPRAEAPKARPPRAPKPAPAVAAKPAPAVAAKPAPAPAPAVAVAAAPEAPVRHTYDGLVKEGYRQMGSGKAPGAMALFEEAAKLRPDGVTAMTGIAYAWLRMGDARRAAENFQRAMIKDGNYGPALFGLGEAYRDQGRKSEALSAFKLYLSRYPGSREAAGARKQVELLSK